MLWRLFLLTPSHHLEVVELRAPSQQLAIEKAEYWKPYHTVALDPNGLPMIQRQATPLEEVRG